jgi:hypothetical protein
MPILSRKLGFRRNASATQRFRAATGAHFLGFACSLFVWQKMVKIHHHIFSYKLHPTYQTLIKWEI